MTNCLVSDNTGGYYGVGIYLGGATMNINYSTIYNNGAGSIRGNGCTSNIYNINNSIIKSINGNGGGCAQYNINNSFTNGSFWTGTGNINLSSNLNFVDASNQDYRLSDSSICIGAASNDSIITDIVGNNRPNPMGSNSDIEHMKILLHFLFCLGVLIQLLITIIQIQLSMMVLVVILQNLQDYMPTTLLIQELKLDGTT